MNNCRRYFGDQILTQASEAAIASWRSRDFNLNESLLRMRIQSALFRKSNLLKQDPHLKLLSQCKSFFNRYRLAVASGVFIGTSYIPFPPWAILFALVPWAIFTLHELAQDSSLISLKRLFISGWLTQFILTLIGFHWIAYTASEFGHFPRIISFLILVGFASFAHLYYALAPLALGYILKKFRPTSSGLSVAILFLLFSVFECIWPSIFPWHLGYTWLWAKLPGYQTADWIGFEGLNLITLTCNGLFALGFIKAEKAKTWRAAVPSVIGAVVLFILVNMLGTLRGPNPIAPNQSVPVVIVQGNIGNYEKLIAEYSREFSKPIIKKYLDLTHNALVQESTKPLVVVWPETAYADYLNQQFKNEESWQKVSQFAQANQVLILTGAYSINPVKKETYNGLFAMGPKGELLGEPYHKTTLIPFGEKFPLSEWIPYQKWLFPNQGAFGFGSGPMVMELPFFKLGPEVCLDSLNPTLAAKTARLGAEVFLNVTNDSWFGHSFEPYQHLIMTAARAVENRRPMIRATNTGISTLIDANGTIGEMSPQNQEWFKRYQLDFKANPTVSFYSFIAGYSFPLALTLLVALFFFAYRNRNRAGKDK